ncbi:MAG: phosphatase PAP2 family protein [Erysipelotrichaceae bacterium]|nr:phosphatase PAP2 family protein [Erysipelotrichaceae bacterium]
MGSVFQFDWEVDLIISLQELISQFPFLKHVFVLFTYFGEPVFGALIVAVLYFSNKKEWGRYVILSALTCQVVTDMIKNLVFRIRPYIVNESIECLKPVEPNEDIYDPIKQGFSFPSAHVTFASSLATGIGLKSGKPKYSLFLLPLVILVAISRFSLGVHYPGDVIAGALIGLAGVFLFDLLYRKAERKRAYLLLAALCVPGMAFCISEDYFAVCGLLMGFMCGDLYQERYVRFEDTDDLAQIGMRLLGAAAVFLGFTELLKVASGFLTYGSRPYLLYRTFRYGISTFMAFGVYPYSFAWMAKIRKKQL